MRTSSSSACVEGPSWPTAPHPASANTPRSAPARAKITDGIAVVVDGSVSCTLDRPSARPTPEISCKARLNNDGAAGANMIAAPSYNTFVGVCQLHLLVIRRRRQRLANPGADGRLP